MHAPTLEQILNRLDLGALAPIFEAHGIDDSLLGELSDEDLQKIGVAMLGSRKRLLRAFAEAAPGEPRAAVQAKSDPAAASRELPFVGSLGLPFVPISRDAVLFGVWPLRVSDYRAFCEDAGMAYPPCDFEQGSDHPAVGMTWNDATAFCKWLTEHEREGGWIDETFFYRLPLDREWSTAVGIAYEIGRTPEMCSGKAKGYPWGGDFPPPRNAGNYHPLLGVDDFRETSPVGSFAANDLGIYDLGGNVWEWCQDIYEPDSHRRVLRGASCFNDDEEYMLSSYRNKCLPDEGRNNVGIRLVLAPVQGRDSWY